MYMLHAKCTDTAKVRDHFMSRNYIVNDDKGQSSFSYTMHCDHSIFNHGWLLSCIRSKKIAETGIKTGQSTQTEMERIQEFGKKYAEAWSSQVPASVASFFSDEGTLKVNDADPAIGRDAITEVAQGFMTTFPDMVVLMDSLITTDKGTEFHWTLIGTNTSLGGTGKKVRISGYELWHFDEAGLILKSIGSFNAEEYERQLQVGVDE